MKLPFPFFLIRVFKTKELNKGRYRQKIAKQCMKKTRLSREKLYKGTRKESAAKNTVTKMKNIPGGSKVAFIKQKEKNKQT